MIYKSTVPDYDPDYNICKVFSRIVVDMALMALVHLLFTRMAAAVLPDRMPVPSGHIPGMIVALLLIMAYTELIRGERTLAWIGGTLIQLGMALQVCLAPAYSAASASDTVRLSWVLVFSTAAALAVVPVLYVGAEYLCGRYRLYWFTAGLSALYTICLMLSVSISDSNIWYFFGPMTWPLLLTLLALVMVGAVFADPFRMPWRKITDALLLLLVNSVFLLAVGKPSLVLFLAVVTLLTGNIYLPAKKARSALIIGSAPIVCGLCALWYGNMASVPGDTLFEKLKLQLAPLGSGQHTALAKQILINAPMLPQPLPLDSAATIPLDRVTYAFTNLVQRFGWLTGLAAVLLALLLFCRSAKYCTRNMPPAQSGAGMALLLFAAVNTFTSATTGMGLLPGIGAHFLFLDSSGSFYAAACLILVYLLGCGTPVRPRLRVHLWKLSVGLMAWTIVLIISAGWLVLK